MFQHLTPPWDEDETLCPSAEKLFFLLGWYIALQPNLKFHLGFRNSKKEGKLVEN